MYLVISSIANASLTFLLGLFVLHKDHTKPLNRSMAYVCFAVAFWALFYAPWQLAGDKESALLWVRLLMLGAIFIPITYFHFMINFLNIYKEKRKLLIAGYIATILVCFSVFTPWFIRDLTLTADVGYWPQAGLAFFVFMAMFIGIEVYNVFLAVDSYKAASPIKRAQIKYMLTGIAISLLAGPTNWLLWFDIPIKPYGNALASVYVFFSAYAIIRYKFMDIRVVLRNSSVYVLSFIVLFIFAIPAKLVLDFLAPQYNFWSEIIILVVSVIFFPYVKNSFSDIANRYFFTAHYNPSDLLSSLGDRLRSTLDLEKIYYSISSILLSSFHSRAVAVYIYNEKKGSFELGHIDGYDFAENVENSDIQADDECIKLLEQNGASLVEDIEEKTGKKSISQNTSFFADVAVPFRAKKGLIGFMLLGSKESGDIYDDDDLRVLNIIGTQAGFAIENASLYEETLEFNEKLKDEQNKTAAIIDNFVDPILVISENGRLTLFNPASRDVFGLQNRDIGERIDDSSGIYSMTDFKKIIKTDYKVKTADDLKNADSNEEEVIIEHNKRELTYKVITVEVIDDKNNKIGIMKIFYDLTREKMIDKIKSDFITVAAHQLRTPLSAIKWVFKLVLDEDAGKINDEQKELLLKGFNSNERVINLINDMLDVSRIEEGRFGYSFDKNSIREPLNAALSNLRSMAEEKNLNLTTDLPSDLPLVYIDENRMRMAIQNLLENAVKYTPEYGTVEISASVKDNYLWLKILDNGVGVPEDGKEKLFSKFFRAKNVVRMQTEGSGLGLFIVKNIVEKHDGQILVNSEEGKGTEFSIGLPLDSSVKE